jgi:diguanylate cyclase (GGDEF)-like protein/PAS domain S-box-containing protein
MRAMGSGNPTTRALKLLDCVIDAIIVLGPDLSVTYANRAAADALGHPSSPTGSVLDIVHPDDHDIVLEGFADIFHDTGGIRRVEVRCKAIDEYFPVEAVATNLFHDPDINGIVVCFRDLRREWARSRDVTRLIGALEASADLVMLHLTGGELIHMNRSAREFFGVKEDESIPAQTLYPFGLADRLQEVATAGSWNGEAIIEGLDGHLLDVSLMVTPIVDSDGLLESYSVVARDISEHKRNERELAHQAMHDPLTGLANRTTLLTRLAVELHPANSKGSHTAVVFIDLDHFKQVNDTLGHESGDLLLQAVATRLSGVLRPHDLLARVGGDEFVAILAETNSFADAHAVALRLAESLELPFDIGGDMLTVTASIGIALDDNPAAQQPEVILRHADVAMYAAKRSGRHRVVDYVSSLQLVDQIESVPRRTRSRIVR